MWSKYVSNNVRRDFRVPVSAFATVARQSFNGKFTAILDHVFYVTITDTDIESITSLRTLFSKYLDHMVVKFEQNCTVRNIQKFELFGKKWLTILKKESTPF